MSASEILSSVANALKAAMEGIQSLAAAVQEQKADIPVEDIHTSVQDINSLISQCTAQGRTVPFKFLSQTISPGNYERRDYQKCYQAYIKIFPQIAHLNLVIPEDSCLSSRLNLKQALSLIAEIPKDSGAYQDALSSAIDEIEQIRVNSKGEKYEQEVNPACNFILDKLKKMLELIKAFNGSAHVPEEEQEEEEEEKEERSKLIMDTLEGFNAQIQEATYILYFIPPPPEEVADGDYNTLIEILNTSIEEISTMIDHLGEIKDQMKDFVQSVKMWE